MATLTFWTDDKTKERLGRLASKLNRSQSSIMNLLVQQVLKTNGENLDDGEEADPIDPEGPARKITARLKPTDFAILLGLAENESMKPSTWVGNLIRAKLKTGQTLNREEVAALRESTRQLQALGRNLNQLVRATNIEWRELERLKREDIKRLTSDIKAHTDKVGAILSGNLQRWTE